MKPVAGHNVADKLLPCPFCGAGETMTRENGRVWLGMRYSDPVSVSVIHHCANVQGQPSRMIERVGRDAASAVVAWNTRADPAGQAMEVLRELVECEAQRPNIPPLAPPEAYKRSRDAWNRAQALIGKREGS